MLMSQSPTIAYLTSGAAGMICGSCLRDNTLALALRRLGIELVLVPTYTPTRTDEENASEHTVFYGGINVVLQQKYRLFRWLPAVLDRWLDRPAILNTLARFAGGLETKASELGELTVSLLQGERGRQHKEVDRLVDWLGETLKPDLINLSNILIAGCVPEIKRRLRVPVLVTLQGDDIFLDELALPYKSQAIAEIRRLARYVDGFIVFSQYYADYMSDYLGLARDKVHVVSLGIHVDDFGRDAITPTNQSPSIGYLARVCPAKGFHLLVDAFLNLSRMPGMQFAKLLAAGWLAEKDRPYFAAQQQKIVDARLSDRFEYCGVLDRKQKVDFLRRLDVLSVPTVYREPKGLYVLEALASSVPVVQPAHGIFPELLAATGGGRLVAPEDAEQLAQSLYELLRNHNERSRLGAAGRENVRRSFTAEVMARETLAIYLKHLRRCPREEKEPACFA